MVKRIFQTTIMSFSCLFLAGCGADPQENYQVSLEVWGTFDDTDAYQEIFTAYKELNPHVKNITYRKLPTESYRQDLIDALAAGNGPDIFLLRNSWAGDFNDKLVAAPVGMIPTKNYQETFPDVATQDFVGVEGQIYGVPLSVDSLALYYNKDIFNANGIARPPVTWEEVVSLVPRLTKVDSNGNITQSAIALGTATNINRPTDILSALLYQKNSAILSADGRPSLTDVPSQDAVAFYMQFSDIRSPLYTWNANLHYSLDAFYEGTLAMMINYSWQYPALKQKNAKLNIGVAPLPQFTEGSQANHANYWGYGVAKNKTFNPSVVDKNTPTKENYDQIRTFESWQFLKFLAFAKEDQSLRFQNALTGNSADLVSPIDPSKIYLSKTMKPAARRDLLAEQQSDAVLAPFASGNLINKNWLRVNTEPVEGVLAELISNLYSGSTSMNNALTLATRRIETLTRE